MIIDLKKEKSKRIDWTDKKPKNHSVPSDEEFKIMSTEDMLQWLEYLFVNHS